MQKSIYNLAPEDFHNNLIWRSVDDLEDQDMEVTPYEEEIFDMEQIYLIASKFILSDGSEGEGYIRFSSGTPIVMALAVSNTDFILFAVEGKTEKAHTEFSHRLNKNYDNVFPIQWQTKVKIYLKSTVY